MNKYIIKYFSRVNYNHTENEDSSQNPLFQEF